MSAKKIHDAGAPRGGVVAVIGFILVAIATIAVLAVVVGVLDAAGGPEARRLAAERRARWEARQPEYHGPAPDRLDDGWDDD